MSSRLYVGNLSYATTVETLRAFFATVGEVRSVEIVVDRATNRSKGFGFVEMGSPEAAQQAMQQLNGKLLDSRPVRIDLARPKEPRPAAERAAPQRPTSAGTQAPAARASQPARQHTAPARPTQARLPERKRRSARRRLREEETPRWLQNKRLLLSELDEEF